MTCNDDDCLSCNPLYYCDEHDVEYRWYDYCWLCEDGDTNNNEDE